MISVSVTILLMLITVGLSLWAWSNENILYKLALSSYDASHYKQYYRLLTSGFVHIDFMHLGFNMLAMYGFGHTVEFAFVNKFGFIGELMYVAMYLLVIIVANLPGYQKYKNDSRHISLGASGGISALVLMSVLFSPMSMVTFFFIPMPAIMMGVLFIGYSYYMGRNQYDNVDHECHLYGALCGIIAVLFLFPEVIVNFSDNF